jgi:RimJ/RimL family protein N-acetyltransferase
MRPPPAPSLETARLHLRPFIDDDLKTLHAHWALPEVRRYLFDDIVVEPERIEEIIQNSHQLFRKRGFGLW